MSSKRSLHRRANEHTLIWLEANYEIRDGICLPRCLLYHHYLDYMRKRGTKPIGAAAFGKLVRQKFPKITTRRLGTRGQSKYHYYGVGIKSTSIYFEDERPPASSQIPNRNSCIKQNKLRNKSRKVIRASKISAQMMPQLNNGKPLLRHFPRANDFVTPVDVQRDKLSTFLIMYRSHCQRILDTFVIANGEEVEKYLIHFWNGIPQHLSDLLEHQFMVNVIECADSVLYTAIEEALSPKSMHEMPEQFSQELIRVMNLMPKWIESSMKQSPHYLMNKKLEVLQQFSSALRRQLSFLQLVKSCKLALSQPENVTLMCREFECIETYEIWSQIVTLCADNQLDSIYSSFCELMSVLRKGINIQYLTDWVNNIVEKCVVNGKCACLTSRASQLVFALSTYLSGIIRDLTLNNAKSFGFWHLLFVTLEEYVLLMVSRAIRYESQSVRRLTIMKQPLNNVTSYSWSNQMNGQNTEQYNDMNLLMSIACHPWQDIEDFSSSYLSASEYTEVPITTSNTTITSNGNVYTCLT